MKRGQKWALGLVIAAAALGAAWLAVAWWLPTDEELAARLTAEGEVRLGVKVTIVSAHWALLPTPVIVVNDFRTQQTQPVVIRQLSAYPKVRALLDRKLVFERVDIDDAVFPRSSVRAFHGAPDTGDGVALERFGFRNVTWISYSGIAVVYDGEIVFDEHWRPRHAELRRPGISPPFTLTLTREGDAESWKTRIHVGGGTVHGDVALKSTAGGAMHLSGQLAPHDVEVASALTAFNRRSPVDGRGSGRTVLSADGNSFGELVRSLHTRTMLSINPATVLRFDLDKTMRTRGKEHGGQTALQELTGRMDTQNTDAGIRVTYSNVKARAGKYTGTGEATIYHRHIEGSGTLSLAEGTISSVTISGPLDKPKLSAPPGFFAGAAIGDAVLPGKGTVLGARIGGALGRIFGGGAQQPDAPAPVALKKD